MYIRQIALLVFVASTLVACSSSNTPEPVGIGSGVNNYQRSPCACLMVPMTLPSNQG